MTQYKSISKTIVWFLEDVPRANDDIAITTLRHLNAMNAFGPWRKWLTWWRRYIVTYVHRPTIGPADKH